MFNLRIKQKSHLMYFVAVSVCSSLNAIRLYISDFVLEYFGAYLKSCNSRMNRDAPFPVRTGIQPVWYPVGIGCEELLLSDRLIGGISTSRVEYSVGLVPSVETDI
jgi:hypothetical protein